MRCASVFLHFPDILPNISNAFIDICLPTVVPGQKGFTYAER